MSSEDKFDPPGEEPCDEPRCAINDGIMGMTIIVLVVLVWLLFFLHVYDRWLSKMPARFLRRRRPRSAPGRIQFNSTGQEPPRLRNVGLDSAILGTMPVFLYKSQNFRDAPELCIVCQYALQENENVRLLPTCKHIFHVGCIDKWFLSNSTCPICRTRAQRPEEQVLKSARVEQVSATISEPITSGIHDNLNSEQRENASCSGRQEQMSAEKDEGTSGARALMGLTIEVPRSPDGFESPLEAHQPCSPNGSQSSSRDTQRIPVFPSDHPAECNDENNEQ